MTISALVLAAGKSSRTAGRHKLLLPWKNKPILAHVVDNILQAGFSEVIVVAGYEAEQIRAALAPRPVRLVINPDYANGLSASIKSGLAAISNSATGVLFALGDMPLVEAEELKLILASYARAPHATIAVPVHHGRRGNPALFDLCHRAAMNRLTGDAGCKTIIQQHPADVIEVEMPNDHVLRDVDTMEEYQQLEHFSLKPIPKGEPWKPKPPKPASIARS
jgi:molybdenum cofactor cytidylyltransferase